MCYQYGFRKDIAQLRRRMYNFSHFFGKYLLFIRLETKLFAVQYAFRRNNLQCNVCENVELFRELELYKHSNIQQPVNPVSSRHFGRDFCSASFAEVSSLNRTSKCPNEMEKSIFVSEVFVPTYKNLPGDSFLNVINFYPARRPAT